MNPALEPSGNALSIQSSANTSFYADFANSNDQAVVPSNNLTSLASSSNATTSTATSFSDSTNSTNATSRTSEDTDHLQQLRHLSKTAGLKLEDVSNSTASAVTSNFSPDAYPYYNWNLYQFNQAAQAQAMAQSSFAWSAAHPYTGPWHNYAQNKKGRQTYQRYQTGVLEQKFQQNSYVSKKQREELRSQTGLTDRQIKIWFQNRRMKAKKEKNRCDEATTDHQSITLPSTTKSLNNSLSTSLANGSSMMNLGTNQLEMPLLDDDKKSLSHSPLGTTSWQMNTMMGMHPFHTDPMNTWNTMQHLNVQQMHNQGMQGYYNNPYPLGNHTNI